MKMNFTGKVVLITGAGSGIGAATAKVFANLGASLALTDKNVDNLLKVAVQCEKNIHTSLLVPGELTDDNERRNVLEKTVDFYGKLDVLVNNAGIFESGGIENTSLEQLDRVMSVNIRSIYHLTQLSLPLLIKSKGNVVNVSSLAGIRSLPGVLAYSISKSSLSQFTNCIALEVADKDVRVNSVNPGSIITNIHKCSGMSEEAYQKYLERAKETHAVGRIGRVEEVANVITFLASSQASFITGASFLVDGGRHLICSK